MANQSIRRLPLAPTRDEKLPEFVVGRDGYVVHLEDNVYAISDQKKYEQSRFHELSYSEAGVPAAGAMMEFYDMDPVEYPEAEVTARIYMDENGDYYSTVCSYFDASLDPIVIQGIGIELDDIPNLTQDLTCMKEGMSHSGMVFINMTWSFKRLAKIIVLC